MTRTNALAKIKKLLTCNAEEREADIQLSSRLRDIVPLDTLFHAFIGEVEEMFELNTMTPKQLDRLVTVDNLLNYVLDEIGEDVEELPLGDPRNPDAPATINTPAGVFDLDQLAEEAYIAYGKRTHAPSQFTSRWNQLTPVGKEAWRDAVRSVVTTILS